MTRKHNKQWVGLEGGVSKFGIEYERQGGSMDSGMQSSFLSKVRSHAIRVNCMKESRTSILQ